MSRVLPQIVDFLETSDFPAFPLDVTRDQVLEFLDLLRENTNLEIHRMAFPVETMTNDELADLLTSKTNQFLFKYIFTYSHTILIFSIVSRKVSP